MPLKGYAQRHWRNILLFLLIVTLAFAVPVVFIVVSYAGTFSIGAIAQMSGTLLTVEGFLLGLSSLIERRARIIPTTLGIIAIMSSLWTIAVTQIELGYQTEFPQKTWTVTTPIVQGVTAFQSFAFTVALFIFMLEVYWGSIASTLSDKKNTDRTSHYFPE